MDIVAIIPARYASTRFPGKLLVKLDNKPIIQHVFERTRQSKLINTVIIATDDDRISDNVKRFGGNVMMTSANHKSGTDRIAEVAQSINADIIVNVQGDEPLIEPSAIDSAIEPLINNSEILISTLAHKITNKEELLNPNVVKVVIDKRDFAIYFSRSIIPFARDGINLAKQIYYKHVGVYVYRRDFLLTFCKLSQSYLEKIEKLEQLRALENGYKIKVVKTNYKSIGIDTQEDLERLKIGR